MAETQSPNYKWIKPDIGGDASTWGNVLNQTIDAVDSVVWANQQAGLPIGSVSMFAGATAPPNWLICDGASLPTTGGTYDGLFAAIGYAHGGSGANFNLPNLASKFPLGANPSNPVGQAAGSYTYTLDVSNLPAHAHPIADVAHNHGVNDPTHAHSVADPTHTHGASQDPHSHGGVMTQAQGYFSLAAQPPYITSGRTDTQQPAVHISAAGTGIGIYGAATGISLNASGSGLSTTQNAGGGAAMNIVPSYVALNFIIRYK